MKLRRSASSLPPKVQMEMTPMIDIVFQLLIFFVFSFKIVAPEGDFNIKMPVGAAVGAVEDVSALPLRVRLRANADGTLAGIDMNDEFLAGGFEELHSRVINLLGGGGPSAAADATEVEIDADFQLKYRYVVEAIDKISGYVDKDGRVVKLIQKVRFSPPKAP